MSQEAPLLPFFIWQCGDFKVIKAPFLLSCIIYYFITADILHLKLFRYSVKHLQSWNLNSQNQLVPVMEKSRQENCILSAEPKLCRYFCRNVVFFLYVCVHVINLSSFQLFRYSCTVALDFENCTSSLEQAINIKISDQLLMKCILWYISSGTLNDLVRNYCFFKLKYGNQQIFFSYVPVLAYAFLNL